MMRLRRTGRLFVGVIQMMAFVVAMVSGGESVSADDEPREGRVQVALLTYGSNQSAACFSTGFLDLVARETGMPVSRTFAKVELADDDLFTYPFVIFAGDESFTLNETELANLQAYIEQGGFVLASAACSSRAWAVSFREVMSDLFGDDAMQTLSNDHALFHTLYEIDRVQTRRHLPDDTAPPLLGRSVNGTLRVVFSPVGLNDTDHAGGGCCCCGGNEIRNAQLINANLLIYALTH